MTFCANCGNSIKQGLNYCNQCGGKIQDKDEPESTSVAQNLSSSLGYIGVAGLGVLVGIIAILMKNNFDTPALIIVIALYLATLLGICLSIINLILKVSEKPNTSKNTVQDARTSNQLETPDTKQLEEPQQPASVVENTTRTLDKVPIDRQ